jgi:periplasmic divalent cation tolerance protein
VSVVTVYAVFADSDEAERIGRAMVEQRLAACVNLLGMCRSIYRWDGTIEEASEVPALFKTTMAQSDALIAAIAEAHSYNVPAIVVWPIAKLSEPYAAWVEDSLG